MTTETPTLGIYSVNKFDLDEEIAAGTPTPDGGTGAGAWKADGTPDRDGDYSAWVSGNLVWVYWSRTSQHVACINDDRSRNWQAYCLPAELKDT